MGSIAAIYRRRPIASCNVADNGQVDKTGTSLQCSRIRRGICILAFVSSSCTKIKACFARRENRQISEAKAYRCCFVWVPGLLWIVPSASRERNHCGIRGYPRTGSLREGNHDKRGQLVHGGNFEKLQHLCCVYRATEIVPQEHHASRNDSASPGVDGRRQKNNQTKVEQRRTIDSFHGWFR